MGLLTSDQDGPCEEADEQRADCGGGGEAAHQEHLRQAHQEAQAYHLTRRHCHHPGRRTQGKFSDFVTRHHLDPDPYFQCGFGFMLQNRYGSGSGTKVLLIGIRIH